MRVGHWKDRVRPGRAGLVLVAPIALAVPVGLADLAGLADLPHQSRGRCKVGTVQGTVAPLVALVPNATEWAHQARVARDGPDQSRPVQTDTIHPRPS